MRHGVDVRLDLLDQALLLQPRDDRLARGEAVEPVQFLNRLSRVAGLGSTPLGEVRIGRRAGASPSGSRMLICGRPWRLPTSKSLKSCAGVIFTAPEPFSGSEYSSATMGMRRPTSGRITCLPTRCLVALVVGMHGDGGVAEHGLGPRGGDDDVGRCIVGIEGAAFERIAQMPEMALHLDLLDFEVGDGGEQLRVPIDEALVLVDEPGAVELDEHLAHGAGQPLVHGEALARPVAGGAEALQLIDDQPAGLLLPLPDALDELLAAERRGGPAPGAPSTAARPPSAWRCRHGRCPAARARPCRACARSGRACPAACC